MLGVGDAAGIQIIGGRGRVNLGCAACRCDPRTLYPRTVLPPLKEACTVGLAARSGLSAALSGYTVVKAAACRPWASVRLAKGPASLVLATAVLVPATAPEAEVCTYLV